MLTLDMNMCSTRSRRLMREFAAADGSYTVCLGMFCLHVVHMPEKKTFILQARSRCIYVGVNVTNSLG